MIQSWSRHSAVRAGSTQILEEEKVAVPSPSNNEDAQTTDDTTKDSVDSHDDIEDLPAGPEALVSGGRQFFWDENFYSLFSYLDSVDSTERMVEEDPLSEEEKQLNEESQESEDH